MLLQTTLSSGPQREKSVEARTLFRIERELARRSFCFLRHKERHVSKAEAALLASVAAAK
jgi:hypothetical protein